MFTLGGSGSNIPFISYLPGPGIAYNTNNVNNEYTEQLPSTAIFNDILHMSFLAGTHVFKAYPAYTTTTEI